MAPVELSEDFEWRGRTVRWGRAGSGPDLVFCHGTPWSSWLWLPYAEALAAEFTVHVWDMPGYGQSSKDPDHRVSLDVQGEVFARLLEHWDLSSPHVVAHDYGGAVSLRAHLLHGRGYASLALVDVVALAPWGSDYFRLVRDHAEVFEALPPAIHEGALRAYIAGASHRGLAAPGDGRSGRAVARRPGPGRVLPADRAGGRALHRRAGAAVPRGSTCRCWSCGAPMTPGSPSTGRTGWPT